jgi:hypothetical protein
MCDEALKTAVRLLLAQIRESSQKDPDETYNQIVYAVLESPRCKSVLQASNLANCLLHLV